MGSRNSKARMVYWKISYSKQLTRCSIFAQLLFTWLIPNTDDLGRMEGDAEIIKGMIFPFHAKVTPKMINAALKELADQTLIVWYKVEENFYIELPNFAIYQKLRVDRGYKSDYPQYTGTNTACHDLSRHDMTSHVEVKGSEVKGSEVKGSEVKGSEYIPFKEIISYLNEKAGTSYKHTAKPTQDHIQARWNEKVTLQDFYTVIDKKTDEWKNTDMAKYLRPITLFSNKFESYLNQKGGGRNGSTGNLQGKAARILYDENKREDESYWLGTEPAGNDVANNS